MISFHQTRRRFAAAAMVFSALTSGCAVGPPYVRPDASAPPAFKEAAGWTPSHPADAIDKGAWWSMFRDPVLDGLETRVAVSNQTLKAYEAAYRQAHQIVAEARSSLFPTISAVATAEATRDPAGAAGASLGLGTAASAGGAGTSTAVSSTGGAVATGGTTGLTTSTSARTTGLFEGLLEASWAPDLWGRIRRTVESDRALAQASAADVANARLSAQATLAEDYFTLRTLDEEAALYRSTVDAYRRFLTLTQDQVRFGTQQQSAVLTAETQLYGAQASLVGLEVQRAQMEHAVAVLVGVPPASLAIKPSPLRREVPTPPITVPSTLLQRRPDVAAAERRMASGNALIGVAVAAYFPDLTLTGEYGSAGTTVGQLFNASSTLWSVGGEAAETLIDFGLRRAEVKAARAVYDQDVATYRQTVLTAFQGVEDELVALRVYQQQEEVLLRTEDAARRAVRLDEDEFKAGTIDYTTVIAAQASLATASLNVLTALQARLQASILLVEDLGGGWTVSDLPKG